MLLKSLDLRFSILFNHRERLAWQQPDCVCYVNNNTSLSSRDSLFYSILESVLRPDFPPRLLLMNDNNPNVCVMWTITRVSRFASLYFIQSKNYINNLYLNRRKIQPKKDNNICKEYDVLIYVFDNMPVWKRVSRNEKTSRKGKQKPMHRETKKLLLFNQRRAQK